MPQEQEIENRLIRGESALETIEVLPEDGIFSLNGMNAVLISPAMLLASGTNYLPEQLGNYTPPRINLAAVAGILREKARAVFQANTADFANFNENNVPLAVTGMDLVFSKPQAYLKLQVWDETEKILLSEKKQIISENALNAWETLSLGASIPQEAKIKVFLVNETEQDAYFDELEIVISNKPTTKIVQENNYYPFGLNMRGLEKVGEPNDLFQYNKKEKDEDTELLDYHARMHNPQTGRFEQVDPHAMKYHSISPQVYVANNPMIFIDPNGKDIDLGNLYAKNDKGELLHKRQVLAFELFLLSKEGKQFVTDRAQKGFKFQGEFFKGLKLESKEGGKLSSKIDAKFQVTDLETYEKTKNLSIGANGLTEEKITENGKLQSTYHMDLDKEGYDKFIEETKDWKTKGYVVLQSVDTWLHEVFLHGVTTEKDFLNGKLKAYRGKEVPHSGDKDHSIDFVRKSRYYEIAPKHLNNLNATFKLGLSYEKEIWKKVIFHGW